MAFELIQYFLSPAPFVSLLAFVVVPAYKRIVLEDGVNLLWTIFFGAFWRVVYPWLLSFEMVQEMIRNATMTTDTTRGDHVKLEL